MRTKALMVAATLAAGLASSMAQSNVYSLNIVGYANIVIHPQYNMLNNPLNLDGTNSASSILQLAPLGVGGPGLDSVWVYTWTGSSFDGTFYESDFPGTGWSKNAGVSSVPAPLLPPG